MGESVRPTTAALCAAAIRRDSACRVCKVTARPVLAAHHIVPVSLGGTDSLRNLVTLCANCHRAVHWLATGDRSLETHTYGLGRTAAERRQLRYFAVRIRRRRLREYGASRTMASSVSLDTALDAVARRNGLELAEASTMQRCFRRAWGAIAAEDRKECSVYLPRGARFLSVNANNHLALRVPAWGDDRVRLDYDMMLIWPQSEPPSTVPMGEFRRAAKRRFKLIPYFSLSLTWEECLRMTARDWRIYKDAVHAGLWMARTQRRKSNVSA